MLHFLAEAAVLQVILLIGLMMVHQLLVPITPMFMLTVCIFSIILYVGGRYIFAGIEYTDICTEADYKREVKLLRVKSVGFVAISVILGIVFYLFGSVSLENRMEFLIVFAIAGVFLFSTQYISLRRSYMKNKELL